MKSYNEISRLAQLCVKDLEKYKITEIETIMMLSIIINAIATKIHRDM